jgi:hypothetical protein
MIDYAKHRVAELIEEGAGFWKACSGCQESCDGYVSEKHYPPSDVFQCRPGSGCRECGGIGAIWDDTDYEEYARFALDIDAEQSADVVRRLRDAANGGSLKSPLGDFGLCDEAADHIEALQSNTDANALLREAVPEDARRLLAEMQEGWSYPASKYGADLDLPEKRVRELHRAFASLGWAEQTKYFSDADNLIRGSGYCLTKLGTRIDAHIAGQADSSS